MGRPEKWDDDFVRIASCAAKLGATDGDLADILGVSVRTISYWMRSKEAFAQAVRAAKSAADENVERSLYNRAMGYTYDAVKIFMPAGADGPVYAPYREHVPPDTTAMIFWLKNRRPQEWRDRREVTGPDGSPNVTIQITTDDPVEASRVYQQMMSEK